MRAAAITGAAFEKAALVAARPADLFLHVYAGQVSAGEFRVRRVPFQTLNPKQRMLGLGIQSRNTKRLSRNSQTP